MNAGKHGYEKPQITDHGTLVEITAGGHGHGHGHGHHHHHHHHFHHHPFKPPELPLSSPTPGGNW